MSKDDSNPFNNFDLNTMMAAWGENPFIKSLSENAFVKNFSEGKIADEDMQSLMDSQRKNLENLQAMNQRAAEGLGALAQKQSEMMKDALKNVKDFSQKSEEVKDEGFDNVLEDAQAVFQRAVASMSSVGEVVKESSDDIMEMASERLKDSMKELEELMQKFKG